MTLAFIVYLIYSINTFKGFVVATLFISVIILLIATVIHLTREDYSWCYDRNGNLKEDIVSFRSMIAKSIKYSFIVCIVSAFITAIIPSEKTAWMMVGAYAGQKIAENEKVQELSGKVIQIIEKRMDEYLIEEVKK